MSTLAREALEEKLRAPSSFLELLAPIHEATRESGIGGMAPKRYPDLAALGLRAMIGGAIACWMTACVAGTLI